MSGVDGDLLHARFSREFCGDVGGTRTGSGQHAIWRDGGVLVYRPHGEIGHVRLIAVSLGGNGLERDMSIGFDGFSP